MNKLSKILLVIIVILVISLGYMINLYKKQKESAKENLKLYLEVKGELLKLEHPDATIQDVNEMLN